MIRPLPLLAMPMLAALAFLSPWYTPTAVPVALAQPAECGDDDPPPFIVKRRSEKTDEDLRKELQVFVPETGFGQKTAGELYKPLQEAVRTSGRLPPDLGVKQFGAIVLRARQPEQFSLPWRGEPDCSLGKEEAERLHVLSLFLRDCLRKSTPQGDVRPNAKKLKTLIAEDADKAAELKKPQAVPTMMQLLQAENTPIRHLLVEMLAAIKGKEASQALAQRALFDLSPEVRDRAVAALEKRPAKEYEKVLLAGLRYPWAAAADHAAEAITALKLQSVVPEMVSQLKEPPPALPVRKGEKDYVLREVVSVNHLSNCILCHAPSLAKDDLIRGRIPIPGEDPPPLYYAETSGLFVRANSTYLRQDFSVVQPVPENGKWPANQRFDYLMRTRPLNSKEVKKYEDLEKKGKLPQVSSHRESLLFALREVTKRNPGESYEAWVKETTPQRELKTNPDRKR